MRDFHRDGGKERGGGFRGGFGGGERRGGFGGGRRDDRGGGRRGGGRDFDRGEMFSTTCAECHKSCEVPFKPTGEKPVFCKDCFDAKRNEGGFSRDRGDRPERGDNRERAPFIRPERSASRPEDAVRIESQLKSLHAKLDAVLNLLGAEPMPTDYEKKDIFRAAEKPVAPKLPKSVPPRAGELSKIVAKALPKKAKKVEKPVAVKKAAKKLKK